MNKKNYVLLLVVLIFILLAVNYPYLDSFVIKSLDLSDTGVVERVIDGDTIVVDGESVRLLGINSPERGERYYDEAKKFLENEVLNKTVRLEYGKQKYDQYKRKLAYVFIGSENVNIQIVESGYANVYILNDKKHEKELREAWIRCVKKDVGLCEKSKDKCGSCIVLKDFYYENEEVVFENHCEFSCELTAWGIKDEGRKEFFFPKFTLPSGEEVKVIVGKGVSKKNVLYWDRDDYVWTEKGDTLFLRDKDKKLVLWNNY